MGEIADMMLEGLLDEETGEYIGDINEGVYGLQSPGFPISYERGGYDLPYSTKRPPKALSQHPCPHCNRGFRRKQQLTDHMRDRHGIDCQEVTRCPDCSKRVKSVGLRQHRRDAHGQ